MKTRWMAALAACGMAVSMWGVAEEPKAEAPEAGAAETLELYAGALAEGDYSKALFFVDMGALRQYLLTRRMAELKARNPGLTAKDLEEISATLQTRELSPGNLRGVMGGLWNQAGVKGMTGWKATEWVPVSGADGEWVARVEGMRADGRALAFAAGMRKVGDEWMVAPDIVERMTAATMARVPQEVPMPDEVSAAFESYWGAWKEGDLETAWNLMGEGYRARHSLGEFVEKAGALVAETGTPAAWKVEHCRALGPGLLGLGVLLTGREAFRSVMVFQKPEDGKWSLEEVQFRKEAEMRGMGEAIPSGAAKGDVAVPGGAVTAPDLKLKDLKTDFKTAL